MMKLYNKSELAFTLIAIAVYCVLQSMANPMNQITGIDYSMSAVFCVSQAVLLLCFIMKNHLSQDYGLCRSSIPSKCFLYYLPLAVLITRNFWNGVAFNFTLTETICYVIYMISVGFIEEVLFRGFLFKAIVKDSVRMASVISSVTFGLGHFLNLINGSGMGMAENLFQITGAIAIGFLFVILYYRGGSLLPCIITHSLINITDAFSDNSGLTVGKSIVFQLILLFVTVAYAFILTRTLPEKRQDA